MINVVVGKCENYINSFKFKKKNLQKTYRIIDSPKEKTLQSKSRKYECQILEMLQVLYEQERERECEREMELYLLG